MEKEAVDIIVETQNPEALDRTLQQLPGCAAIVAGGGTPEGYVERDGGYVVRCFAGLDFLKFAIAHQGYGKVIKELDELI
jgi:hypothetical protein